MRRINPELQARLDAGATTLCRCWRLTRKDGLVLGFTDHDRTLRFDGTEFRAETGLDASTLQAGTGLSVDNAEAIGALSDAAISEDDIRAGRYDGATLEQWLVDWTDPTLRLQVFGGTIGEIRRSDNSFQAELRGLTEALNKPLGRTLLRTCDRVVGDAKCGVILDAAAYRMEARVIEPAGGDVVADLAGGFEEGWFAGGMLTWLTGANAGLHAAVRADRLEDGRRIFALVRSPVLPVAAGDRFRVTAGCDKRAATCREKFNNFLSFRGFPHIPGEDWVLAYPRSGEAHDGTSLVR